MYDLIPKEYLLKHIELSLSEDIGDGDHSSLACISKSETNKAKLVAKQEGIICGIDIAREVYALVDKSIKFTAMMKDGDRIKKGDIIFRVEGSAIGILTSERTALNYMQRLSGIATSTNEYVELIKGTRTKLLDTRKTTPSMRLFEKYAVKVGGGYNHRIGLYDMIMLKDNHIDFAGGVENAITKTKEYLKNVGKELKIEVEVRSMEELERVLKIGGINRIMLDNFTPELLQKAIERIGGKYETESSGGINKDTILNFAKTGVDFISVGALTHQIKSLDLSLVAQD
ncbi:MAG: carboxylating nicotinate-nucleotide diphosphorylase [Bacteroidaceae bacterium]|nr:carboxylating nicotinate-nucleotide diphosphorylase [Bacteroidaceae bacterium]MEA5099999.1 carboxylating nicotinate-nucleotide diphosphorylase [Bacteroidales bacterium]